MSKMTQEQWDEMSAEEKRDHIITTPWTVSKQSGLNGKAKVGDLKNAIVTRYSVVSGGVMVSGWHGSQVDAMKEAIVSAEEYIKEATLEQSTD